MLYKAKATTTLAIIALGKSAPQSDLMQRYKNYKMYQQK
jgi:hypothetical protein